VLPTANNNRIFIGVRESPTGADKIFLVTSAVNTGSANGFDIMLYKTGSFIKGWTLDGSIDFDPGGSLSRNHHASVAIGAYDNTGGTEDLILRYEIEQKQSSDGVGVRVYSGLDLALLNSTSSTAQCDSAGARSFPNHIYYIDMSHQDKDTIVLVRTRVIVSWWTAKVVIVR